MDLNVMESPIMVKVELDEGWIVLEKNGDAWQGGGVELACRLAPGEHSWDLSAPEVSVKRILLRWRHGIRSGVKLYGDHWERAYGDLEWRGIVGDRVMPWYFLIHNGQQTVGIGVKTGASSLCHWEMDDRGVTLSANVMSGPKGVQLGSRVLVFAQIVQYRSREGESAHEAAQALCRFMCPNPVLPDHPVYGGNNWYYAFGQFRPEDAVADAQFMAELAGDNPVRPYMVLDDGWQMNGGSYSENGGPWTGNRFFPDMRRLAADMAAAGALPGIWCRPLLTFERVPESWVLPGKHLGKVLDPSIPEVLEYVASDIRRMSEWGYRLIKHDFSSLDLLNRWGNDLGANPSGRAQVFHDSSKTTAEIIVDLYRAIADAAGTSLVMGCNTIGHLAAGVFAIQRTGDDVSGRGWERTRRMGVNTLAFRMHQHGTLYSHDADCVALTASTPWNYARQWLDLVARSGTPLFLSVSPSLATPEQKLKLKMAFQIATAGQQKAIPLDWLETNSPSRWQFGADTIEYDWYGDRGLRNEDQDHIWWR